MYGAINAVGLLLLVVGLPLALRLALGARGVWFALGIGSWAAAVAGKHLLQAGLRHTGFGTLPAGAQGAVWGLISAAAELGATALLFHGRTLPAGDVLATGAGVGAFEVLYVLGTVLAATAAGADRPDAGGAGQETAALVQLSFLLQRSLAMVGHVASRTLVYLAVRHGQVLPALIAVGVFALVDGVAYAGLVGRWDWTSPRVLACYYGFIVLAGAAEAAAAWVLWHRLTAGSPTS